MPNVNELSKGKPATKVPASKVAPTIPPINDPQSTPVPPQPTQPTQAPLTQSTDTKALAKAASTVKLPAWLQTTQLPTVSDRQNGGYVGFASSASEKWAEQVRSGLQDGQPYLYHQQRYIPLQSLDFFLLAGTSFQSLMVGKKGEFLWVSEDMTEVGPTSGSNKPQPHYVCALLVFAEGRIIPIKGDFIGTKSGGIEGAIRAVEAAASPEWLKMSDAHKISSYFPQPFGRVFNSITTSRHISKSGPNRGNPYYRANCTSVPATLSQMSELIEAFKNEDFQTEVEEMRKNYETRVDFLKNIAVNGPARG